MNLRSLLAQSQASHAAAFKLVRARARLAPAGTTPPVLVNSVPKAGTHLVSSILDHTPDCRFSGVHLRQELFDRERVRAGGIGSAREPDMDWEALRSDLARAKRGQYETGHLWAAPELSTILAELGYRVVFLCRDPRDVVVSTVAYVKTLRRHRHNARFKEDMGGDEARMLSVIEGFPDDESGPGRLPLGERFRVYLGWRDDPQTLWCRFEDLVGERGAGDAEAQERLLVELFRHVGMERDGPEAMRIAAEAWGTKSATFRSGRLRAWEDAFTPRVAAAFDRQVGPDLLAALGYE